AFNVGTLAANNSSLNGPDEVVVTISATAPTTCGELPNPGTVDSAQTSPQTSPPPTIVNVTGCAAPTLSITKAASSSQVTAGAAFTYTITVKNTGDAPATGVPITA